jgi:acetolactate decarboxylase
MPANKIIKILAICLTCVCLLFPAGCSSEYADNPVAQRETLMQVSTIGALMDGFYDPVIDVGQLKEYGDFGLGTFEGLDGEMVVLDGECYQVKADGVAYLVDDSIGATFADVTFFDSDFEMDIAAGTDFDQLQAIMDYTLPSANIFYAFRIEGTFSYMQTRSVPGQQKPYPPLVEVVAEQAVFDFNDVSGTIVGFYCPPYASGVGVAGYHLHFLTEDLDAGGHILNFTVTQATAYVDYTPQMLLILPEGDSDFYTLDLSGDDQEQIEEIER